MTGFKVAYLINSPLLISSVLHSEPDKREYVERLLLKVCHCCIFSLKEFAASSQSAEVDPMHAVDLLHAVVLLPAVVLPHAVVDRCSWAGRSWKRR